jgi:catechol 2,3-dioxygenase-like lactoylglutathione lyase family enzyme
MLKMRPFKPLGADGAAAGRQKLGSFQGGIMSTLRSRTFSASSIGAAACALFLGLASATVMPRSHAAPQFITPNEGQVIGVAFDGRMVSDLDKSVAFYKLIGFTEVPDVDKSWRADEAMNRIHGVKPGVQSRMAKLTINSNISGKPFTLYLREFKGIRRKSVMSGKTAWEPGATHIDLTIPDADVMWSQLSQANMLWSRTWDNKLIAAPGATKGTIAYITDPDGMDVEIVEKRAATPASNGRPARPADPPGFNHIGLVILDSEKAKSFYGGLLGEQMPTTQSQWASGDFMDSAVGGHGNVLRMVNGTFPEAADTSSRMRFELVEYENRKKPVEPYNITDIGVNYVGFEAKNLDSLVGRLKGAGITMVSDGIVEMKGGYRVALFRDPDTDAFVELFERPKQ